MLAASTDLRQLRRLREQGEFVLRSAEFSGGAGKETILVGLAMSGSRGVYGLVVLVSAFLLFLGEPMAAKQLLPLLGGSSAVWVTCLVFFQATLLLGYAYAHWLVRQTSVRVHLALLAAAVAVLALPWAMGAVAGSRGAGFGAIPAAADHPVETIFVALGVTIGLPFFMLSATSPLLQVWWARREGGRVPYGLFALSNVGSLAALAAYPLLVEPHVALARQREWWAAGFVVYAGVCGWLGWTSLGDPNLVHPTLGDEAAKDGAPGLLGREKADNARVRWMWFVLPMGAAMQLAAVTSHLSQDIAAIPLLWVLPLGVYLVTFVLAFDAPWLYRRWVVARLLVVLLASLGYALSQIDARLPVGLSILFYLAELFVACWFCHAETYRLWPASAERSTVFYLMVAAGGVAGTFFVGIASPLIFRANYDLAIAFLVTAVLAAVVTWNDGWAPRALWTAASLGLLALTVPCMRSSSGRR